MVAIYLLFPSTASSEPGDGFLRFQARVLGHLFPVNVESRPYFSKLSMVFTDSATALTVVTYPGGRSELLELTVTGMADGKLPKYLRKVFSATPEIPPERVAEQLHTTVRKAVLNNARLGLWLKQLEMIRVSPAITVRIGVDEIYQYEFWFDTAQESVHYTLIGPPEAPGRSVQDPLTKWMIDFRSHAQELVSAASETSH